MKGYSRGRAISYVSPLILLLVFGLAFSGDAQSKSYGLHCRKNDKWVICEEFAPSAVVLVHGLDEPGLIWNDLAGELHDSEAQILLRFVYPNDQSPKKSAGLFLSEFRRLRSGGCQGVSIVAHSMGGLVSYDALTRPEFLDGRETYPQVQRLITVGTPWSGSWAARFRFVSEGVDQIVRLLNDDSGAGFREDGDGEAGEDLLPGSQYIEELQKRKLNPDIPLTVIYGVLAKKINGFNGKDDDSKTALQIWQKLLGGTFEKLESRAGDGVVPLDSARATPAPARLIALPGDHISLLRNQNPLNKSSIPPAVPVILNLLNRTNDTVNRKPMVDE